MFGISVDFKPTQDLEQAELEAGRKLAAAQAEDDARQAAVAAGTRRPPGAGERPYMKAGRDRAPVHAANAGEIHTKRADTVERYDRATTAAGQMEDFDERVADPLQAKFFKQWELEDEPDRKGRRLFYVNGVKSDYGNPSYDRNRAWWNAAATTFNKPGVTLPPAIAAYKDGVLSMAAEYGTKLDAAKSARGWFMDGWAELMTLCQACRKDRRITRGYLKEDFDRATGWVDELVPPPSVKGKPAPQQPPPGGNA
jgi:hypothetical protein